MIKLRESTLLYVVELKLFCKKVVIYIAKFLFKVNEHLDQKTYEDPFYCASYQYL